MKIITGIDQRSLEWHALRRGRITMSNAQALLTGGNGVTRANYIREVAAGVLAEDDSDAHYVSHDMARGIELEDFAFRAFEEYSGMKVDRVSFVLHDDERIGCSPDGLMEHAGLEIKCPKPVNHLRNADKAQAMKDYGAQVQGCMWICGKEAWAVVSFCPQMPDIPLIVYWFERDKDVIARLSESATKAADEVDEIVKSASSRERLSRSVLSISDEALNYWKSLNSAMNDEVRLYE